MYQKETEYCQFLTELPQLCILLFIYITNTNNINFHFIHKLFPGMTKGLFDLPCVLAKTLTAFSVVPKTSDDSFC